MKKETLKTIFEKENQLFPDYNKLDFIDLIQCLYSKYGVDFSSNKKIEKLNKVIPKTNHTVFLLIDAMGSNLIDLLDDESIFKKNKIMNLITVNPSSTGSVLSSLATAKYSNQHGILGWYGYNRNFKIDYNPILFADRKNNKNLRDYNINLNDIYKSKSIFNDLNIKTTMLYPESLVHSDFSKYIASDDKRIGYSDFNDAVNKIKQIIKTNSETFTYFYINDVDNLEHDNGVNNSKVINKVREIECSLISLKEINDLTIIVTADHGQIEISNDVIMDFEKYDKYFYGLPSIDFGTASYYIKDGMESEFENEFRKDFDGKMILFETKEFLENKIFGPEDSSQYFLDNLGEYISICRNGYQFLNDFEVESYLGTKGNHSGFSSDELTIPLIVIDNSN